MRTRLAILCLSAALFLTIPLAGCSISSNQLVQDVQSTPIRVQSQAAYGQTFTARHDGLQGIEIQLIPGTDFAGEVVLQLRKSSTDTKILRTSRLSAPEFQHTKTAVFRFPPIKDSSGNDYFLSFQTAGQSQFELITYPAESYLDGALYFNGSPQEAQMGFTLQYNPFWLGLGVVLDLMGWIKSLIACLLLFVIPGWALCSRFWSGWKDFSWIEKLGIASGLTIALYPLIFLWTHLVGMNLGALYAWIPALFSIIFLAKNFVQGYRRRKEQTIHSVSQLTHTSDHELFFIIILGLVFWSRFWALRNIDLPLWGDGYQHTMIAQLLVDNKGLFNQWLPYAELATFTYHFGFHSLAAVFHWFNGDEVPKAVLYSGQFLNFLAVVALYPLSKKLTRNRWAAALTVLIAGLFLNMPMAYLNWSRYTQLAGQVILLVWICMIYYLLDDPSTDPGLLVLSGIVLGGLALTHYRILLLAILFLPAWFLIHFRTSFSPKQMIKVACVGGISLTLALPWLLHAFSGKLDNIARGQLSISAKTATDLNLVLHDLTSYLPISAWIASGLVICWGLWRKDRSLGVLLAWCLFILIFTNPQWLGLSGAGLITNFTIFIAAYIPASQILGFGIGWLLESGQLNALESRNTVRNPGVFRFIAIVLLLLAAIFGAVHRLGDVQINQHILATRPDLRAFTWIQNNIPANARLLVNSFKAFGGTAVVGSDGGWWLPLTANRMTTQPPLNYTSELNIIINSHQLLDQLVSELQEKKLSDPEMIKNLLEQGITHVYVGQLQGSVNSGGPLLHLEEFTKNPNFHLVYRQDRVWIFVIQD